MDNTKKPFVVRVTGIEIGDRLRAEQIVQAALVEEKKGCGKGLKISIVPSCDNPDTCEALVDFDAGVPQSLSGLQSEPLESILLPQAGSDNLTFDCHFHGFTQLYPTPAGQPITAE